MDSQEMNLAAILPAAGLSRRFGARGGTENQSKLSAEIGRKAVLLRAVELFVNRPSVRQIIIAADPDQLETFKFRWADTLGIFGVKIVPGGRTERWESIMNALGAVEDSITHVAVHDAARPVTDPTLIDRLLEAAKFHDAVVPGLPVADTLKRVADGSPENAEADPLDALLGSTGKNTIATKCIVETISRRNLWTVQTPQVFERNLLQNAYEQVRSGKLDASHITDDAGLVETLGHDVMVIEGDPLNIKITVPQDLSFAECVLAVRMGKNPGDSLGPKRKHPTWAQMDDDG